MRRILTGFALAVLIGCSAAPVGELDMGPGSVSITANTIFDPAFSAFRFAVHFQDKRSGSNFILLSSSPRVCEEAGLEPHQATQVVIRVSQLETKTFTFSQGLIIDYGNAAEWSGALNLESGTVALTSLDPNVNGEFDFMLELNQRLAGSFSAPLCPNVP